jgi:hypothetical protein
MFEHPVDICMYLVYITKLYLIVFGTGEDIPFYSAKVLKDIIVNSDIFRRITSGQQ